MNTRGIENGLTSDDPIAIDRAASKIKGANKIGGHNLAIRKTRELFESLGVKTRLSQYGVAADQIPVIVENLKAHGWTALSETQDQTLDISRKILEKAL